MKRLDNDRVSLVEFLRSIQFTPQPAPIQVGYGSTRFAHFYPRARGATQSSAEERHLIRSAN